MAQTPPPFPTAHSTSSFWRSSTKPIDNHRTTNSLPLHADIVIIGAGYSGAAITHHLIEESERHNRPIPSIVILEAREACSGATGRNGGHLKPDPYSRAASVLKTHGPAIAEHVASFEARQVKEVQNFVEREGIACDFEETKVFDVCLHEAGREKVEADLASLVDAGISTVREVGYFPGGSAEDVSGIKGSKSCLTYNAARLWPYKLITHMLEGAVTRGVNLQTSTPVTSITPTHAPSEPAWAVTTTRGSMKCHTIIHATNGYASALVPEMKGKIVPIKGMVARLVSTTKAPKLAESYMMRFSDYEYDYLVPRPDGSIVVGGARRDFYKDLDSWFDVSDDGSLIRGAEKYFEGYMQRHFRGWEDCDVRTESLWTGIMGYSDDGFPYVGTVPDKPGQHICAGFNGHGMPQIFLSAKAIAEMVLLGATAEDVDLPLPYRTTYERWIQREEHISTQAWRAVVGRETANAKLRLIHQKALLSDTGYSDLSG